MGDTHAEIREALDAATPGPWAGEQQECVELYGDPWAMQLDSDGDGERPFVFGSKHDAHLIANAPTWLAELLAENTRLREALERIGHEVQDFKSPPSREFLANIASAALAQPPAQR